MYRLLYLRHYKFNTKLRYYTTFPLVVKSGTVFHSEHCPAAINTLCIYVKYYFRKWRLLTKTLFLYNTGCSVIVSFYQK